MKKHSVGNLGSNHEFFLAVDIEYNLCELQMFILDD